MNTFQVVIATDGTRTFIGFLYEDIQWTANTVIGFNAGDGVRSFTLPESLTTAGILNLESTSNVGIPGVYLFRVDQNEVMQPPGAPTLPPPSPTTPLPITPLPTTPPPTTQQPSPTTQPSGMLNNNIMLYSF